MNKIYCNKCKIAMKPGIALEENISAGIPDFIGDDQIDNLDLRGQTLSPDGTAHIINCWKCPSCGHSILIGRDKILELKYDKIAICGYACAGKSEVYKFLKSITKDSIHIHLLKFAEPHYQVLNILQQETKNRLFLQDFSDLAKKYFGKDIFVKIFLQKAKHDMYIQYTVCDDLRYKIEFDAVKENGWFTIFVDADENLRKQRSDELGYVWNPNHNSEKELHLFKNQCDAIFDNNSSFQHLYNQIMQTCVKEGYV